MCVKVVWRGGKFGGILPGGGYIENSGETGGVIKRLVSQIKMYLTTQPNNK